MAQITYQDKVTLNPQPSIPDINKVKDDDMNEIKSVVNANSQTSSNNFGLETNTWTSSGTYAIGDIVVYNENTYKNLTGTNTSTTPDQDSTNWEVVPLIVNEENDSIYNAYSCNEVNNLVLDVYSTDEVKTKKVWIDNKPIYRKVIHLTNVIRGYKDYAHNINNLGNVIEIGGYVSISDGYNPVSRVVADNITGAGFGVINVDTNNVHTLAGSSFPTTNDVYIILEYTKTTD